MTSAQSHRLRSLLVMVITMLAVRAVFGEEIAGFMDGLYIGFTDGI
jgi:hypothetical protein